MFVCLSIVLGWMLWKCTGSFEMYFNGARLSLFTPNIFEINNDNLSEYKYITQQGRSYARTQKIIITGLLRDCSKLINLIISKCENIGNLFDDYAIVILENDSSDNTRELLLNWAKSNTKVTILGCGVNEPECKLQLPKTTNTLGVNDVTVSRIEKMVNLRNTILDYVYTHFNKNEWHYILNIDLDILGMLYLDGVWNTMGWFSEKSSISAICAYGIEPFGLGTHYYDTYAHEDIDEAPNLDSDNVTRSVNSFQKSILSNQYLRGDGLVQVKSCFSGATVYRYSHLHPNKYELIDRGDHVVCEHKTINWKLHNVYVNPSMIYYVVKNG